MTAFIMLCLGIAILYIGTIWKLNEEFKYRKNEKKKEDAFKEENEVQERENGKRYLD